MKAMQMHMLDFYPSEVLFSGLLHQMMYETVGAPKHDGWRNFAVDSSEGEEGAREPCLDGQQCRL
jgi:hypothetical protein